MFQMGRSWLFERVNPTSRRVGPLRPFPRFIFDEPDGCFHAAQIAATSNRLPWQPTWTLPLLILVAYLVKYRLLKFKCPANKSIYFLTR